MVRPIGIGGAVICAHCYQKHVKAITALSEQGCIKNCQDCGVSLVDRAQLVWKDDIYQILCTPCSDNYVKKRADLYGPTEYGWKKGISAGNK